MSGLFRAFIELYPLFALSAAVNAVVFESRYMDGDMLTGVALAVIWPVSIPVGVVRAISSFFTFEFLTSMVIMAGVFFTRVYNSNIYRAGVCFNFFLGYEVALFDKMAITNREEMRSRMLIPNLLAHTFAYGTLVGIPVAITWPVSVPVISAVLLVNQGK